MSLPLKSGSLPLRDETRQKFLKDKDKKRLMTNGEWLKFFYGNEQWAVSSVTETVLSSEF